MAQYFSGLQNKAVLILKCSPAWLVDTQYINGYF